MDCPFFLNSHTFTASFEPWKKFKNITFYWISYGNHTELMRMKDKEKLFVLASGRSLIYISGIWETFCPFLKYKRTSNLEDTCHAYEGCLEIKNNRISERLKYEIAILTGNDVDDDNDYELLYLRDLFEKIAWTQCCMGF